MRTAVAGLVVAVGLVFGWPSVANAASVSGDFNGDGYADLAIFGHFEDLAIGIPYHDGSHTAPVSDAGAVDVVYGRSSGLYTPSMREYTQDTAGAGDAAEQGDHFGAALAAWTAVFRRHHGRPCGWRS
jgi:hypothetical protein